MTETFAQRLARVCEEREITQAELSRLIKTSRRNVHRWFREGEHPQYWALVELAVQLNLSLDYLCGLTAKPKVLDYAPVVPAVLVSPLQQQSSMPVADSWRTHLYSQED